MCVYELVEARDQSQVSGPIFARHILFQDKSLSLNLELTSSARLDEQQTLVCCLSPPSQGWSYRHATTLVFLCECWRAQLSLTALAASPLPMELTPKPGFLFTYIYVFMYIYLHLSHNEKEIIICLFVFKYGDFYCRHREKAGRGKSPVWIYLQTKPNHERREKKGEQERSY